MASQEVESFEVKLRLALKDSSFNKVFELYEWGDIDRHLKESEMLNWISARKVRSKVDGIPIEDYGIADVDFIAAEDYGKSHKVMILEPVKVNGRSYFWRYQPVGHFSIVLRPKGSDDVMQSVFCIMVVGANSKGDIVGMTPIPVEQQMENKQE